MPAGDTKALWHLGMDRLRRDHGWSEQEAFAWLQEQAIGHESKITAVAEAVLAGTGPGPEPT
jgi:hypothetical protein